MVRGISQSAETDK
ncbi:hypothetical protein D049_0923A, partial [Vibrio parahaemolyticus VPTS-2010]